jgi:hypothetical protein
MINYDVPFYSNTSDNTHCYQAALKMVLKYFTPAQEYSWEKLEKITAKVEGLWTWPLATLIWLTDQGFTVKNIEVFDYKKFIEQGDQYLLDEFGREVGQSQINHSDISQEQRLSKDFLKRIATVKEIPTLNDIKMLLEQGFLLICNINSSAINQKEGYSGHAVVVKGFEDGFLFLHDPGLPGLENRKVPFELFERAWAYPNDRAKNIIAIKL